jgi:CRISPR-associated protein Csm2
MKSGAKEDRMGIKQSELAELIKNAYKIADGINNERSKYNKSIGDNMNKISQIRLFYDELQRLQEDARKTDFALLRPSVYLVSSKAAYSAGRKLIGDSMREFLQKHVNQIETKEHLDNFMLYFEAVMGYYRYLNPKE